MSRTMLDSVDDEAFAPPPRRSGRARDPWMRRRFVRIAARVLAVAAVVAVVVPAWAWVRHEIRLRDAYRTGQASARRAIANGDRSLQSSWWSDPGGEVFVDPTSGLLAPQPYWMRCVMPDDVQLASERGFDDELRAAVRRGELAAWDRRPRLRTREAARELLAAADAFAVEGAAGRHACADSGRSVAWTATGGSVHAALRVSAPGHADVCVITVTAEIPARARLVDDGATLLIHDAAGSTQVVDLEHPAVLAWYDGPFAARRAP